MKGRKSGWWVCWLGEGCGGWGEPLFMLSVCISHLPLSPPMGEGGRDGREGGCKRLNWIRGGMIETGEKGRTPGVGANTGGHSLGRGHTHNTQTHSHRGCQDPEKESAPSGPSVALFWLWSLVRDDRLQSQIKQM